MNTERILDLHRQGMTPAGIARRLGVVETSVRDVLCAQSLTPHRATRRQMTEQDRAQLIAMYLGGKSSPTISRETGHASSTILKVLKEAGVTRSGTGRPVSEPPPPPAPPAPPAAGIVGHLIATKGRWSELAKIAAAQGWSSARAQQEYHRARASA